MLRSIRAERFKSLVDLDLDLGRLNVLIGANGSGKSNIIEAVGVLGAAAFGRIDDEALLRRGVRPGVPTLYKCAFALPRKLNVPHISFGATSQTGAGYDVSLWNPLENPGPAWRFKTETLRRSASTIVQTRSTTSAGRHNQEQGMAALETVKLEPNDPALSLMNELRQYNIYCPNTPALRGLVQDLQVREPVGLSGGRLPEAIDELLKVAKRDPAVAEALEEINGLIDWAEGFRAAQAMNMPLSPSAARSRLVIQFTDRYMRRGRNVLSGYDASEGALYILYCSVLALHPRAPTLLAVDNIDQALNPRLARRLLGALSGWIGRAHPARQWIVSLHNPAALDGLPVADDSVRLFTVDRNSEGHTEVNRIDLKTAVEKRPDDSWTLSRMWTAGLLGGVPRV